MRNETRLRSLRDAAALAVAVSKRPARWGTRSHFTMHRHLVVSRVRFSFTVGAHIAPPGNRLTSYRAIVGLHPVSKSRRAENGWHPALAALDWYGQCERFLRRHGYRGHWYLGPYGRFGDFERRCTTRAALVAELARLEELFAETWPLEATRPRRSSGRDRG